MLGLILFPDFYFDIEYLYNNIQEYRYLFQCRVMIEMCQTGLEHLLCLAADTSRSSHLTDYQPIGSLKPPGPILFIYLFTNVPFSQSQKKRPWMQHAAFVKIK